METMASSGALFRHWMYDWGGANEDIYLYFNRAMPDAWLWLPESLTWIGSYLGAPVVAATLLLWIRRLSGDEARRVKMALSSFLLGLATALSVGAAAKSAFAFPRPWVALGESAFRVVGTPDSCYTLPSGHATYVAVLAAAMWPLLGWPARLTLLVFTAGVGWSRIALGAHFPADVLAGFALGWVCVVAAGPLSRWVDGKFSNSGQRR